VGEKLRDGHQAVENVPHRERKTGVAFVQDDCHRAAGCVLSAWSGVAFDGVQ